MTFYFYLGLVLASAVLGWFAQLFANKKTNKLNIFFLVLSASILIFVMGWRDLSVGIDDYNYLRGYNFANMVSVGDYYKINMIEPGFYLLYRLVFFVFNDFQWVIILSSIITITFFYLSITFNYSKISIGLSILVFGLLNYYYYFGIVRLGIAASIVAFALRYVVQGKKKKYVFFVLLATMFHFSALFALILLLYNKAEKLSVQSLKLASLIPLGFIVVRFLVFPLIGAARYTNYVDSMGTFTLGFMTSVPLTIVFWVYKKKLVDLDKSFNLYLLMSVLKISTEIFAPIIGIGRMVWYLNIAWCYLIPATIKTSKTMFLKYLMLGIMLGYCLLYFYNANFIDLTRVNTMIPYKNIFFELPN